MSPILTRPVREQLEHDRVIRQLQARYKRKFDVVINPGHEQNQSVTVGQLAVYPDLLLYGTGRNRRLEGTVEVETGESVNQLEALAEWGVFSKLGVPLHLYVPPASVDSAKRLCVEHQIPFAEIWTFHVTFDQVRFTMIHRAAEAAPKPRPKPSPAKPKAAAKPAGPKARPAAKGGASKAAGSKKAAPRKKAAPARKPPARKPAKAAGKSRAKSAKRR